MGSTVHLYLALLKFLPDYFFDVGLCTLEQIGSVWLLILSSNLYLN